MQQLDNFICFNFYIGWREVTSIYKDVFGKNMTPQKIYVMELLSDTEKVTHMHELSRAMHLDASAVSTLIGRMEKAGLVLRTHDTKDRRAVRVQLTEEGLKLHKIASSKYANLSERIEQDIPPANIERLKNVTQALVTNNKNHHA